MLIVPSGRLLQCLYSAQNFDPEGIARNRHAKYSAQRPPIPVVANSIVHKTYGFLQRVLSLCVPAGSPSRGGDVAVYVFDIHQPSLLTPLKKKKKICSCIYFCLYGAFNCILLHKFSQQLSAFSLGSSGLISAFLVHSTIYLFMKVSLSPDIILCG